MVVQEATKMTPSQSMMTMMISIDAPVLLNGTLNANNGTHNAQQRNLHNEGAANSAIATRHHNPKLASTHILKIQPALKAQMEAHLGKRIQFPSRDQLLHETNRIIGNRNSLVRSAMKLDRQLAGHSDSDPLPPSSGSYQVRLQSAIPVKKIPSKTNRQKVATDMIHIFQVLYELLQEDKFDLVRAVRVEIESFMSIAETSMHSCLTEILT